MGYSCNACGCYVTSGSCNCYSPSPADRVADAPAFSAGDAVFAFSAMLTSLPHVVPFGAAAWATPGADLAAAFNAANGLTVSRDFPQGLVFPKIEGELLDRIKQASEVESHERPAAGEYDRELIACMLQDFRRGRMDTYKTEAVEEQIALLRAADNRDAAGVHTANLSAAPQQGGQEVVRTCMNTCTHSDFFNGLACEKCLATVFSPTGVSAQQPAEAVAVDLERFREPVLFWHNHCYSALGTDSALRVRPEALHLLAIIDSAPQAIDIGKLRELVERWRESAAGAKRYSTTAYEDGCASEQRSCANELAALIGDGGEKWNGR